jgi:acetyltransferase
MSVINLHKMFRPESVALIGASADKSSLGYVVMKNLLVGEFSGVILPVNPKYKNISGVHAYQDISSLPAVPDLAVICTPAKTVPGILAELGERGTRAAVVLSAGFHESVDGQTLKQSMLDAAKPHNLRILGPNCVGLLIPSLGLNASFAHTNSLTGNIAVVSQSGALCTTILDWAKSRNIGFSYFISLGDSADVDFGDLLDYLGSDESTDSILLYIESIDLARKFISAARATSRNKPVVVIKSGRMSEGARAAASHTGALAGNDDVFDAAIRRSGILRVYTINDLFDAVETLARARRVKGNRLIILTNGGGTGVLATDELIINGGRIAELSSESIKSLDEFLPATWSKGNPVDIIGDGGADRYVKTLKVLLNARDYDAILVMLVPAAVIDNREVAKAVTEEIHKTNKPVLTCWMGKDAVAEARNIFEHAGIPSFDTPDFAIRAFMQLVEYDRNRQCLMETPLSITEDFTPDRSAVRNIIENILEDNRNILTEPEAKDILSAYGIPVVETKIANNPGKVLEAAEKLGFPVALKILSRDISHKSDVGGVLLDIKSSEVLHAVSEGMLSRIAEMKPDAVIEGFTVQKMVNRPGANELIIGIATDPIFGPFILFGQGGTSVEIVNDKALALPPLNRKLASDLIMRTRVSKLLAGYRDVPSANMKEIELTLVKISQLITDNPQIVELDINPLYADNEGVIALDARIRIEASASTGAERFAIRPYPRELQETARLDNGLEIELRPVRTEDESALHELLNKTGPEDVYFHFMKAKGNFCHSCIGGFTQIDYDREMAFVATVNNAKTEILGFVRAISDADNHEAEIAIIVRTDQQKQGIGKILLDKMIGYCKSHGTKQLTGQALKRNKALTDLFEKCGFEISENNGKEIVAVSLNLHE